VARGEYLATAGNCVSCHTVEGGEPFAGGVAFHTDFGTIYSTNITPDKQAGIGGWTQEQFERAMREGIRADGAHLYPAFPYPSFTKVTDEDMSAIWAYLQTIEPSSRKATPNELSFPFNQRWLMSVWNTLFLDEGAYEENPEKSEQWNRGAYLVQGLAHCSACHTPRNRLGAEIADEFLHGGTIMDHAGPDGELRPWYAVDLTPSPTGLKAWSAKDIADYLHDGVSNRTSTFGPMNDVIGNSTRHLTREDAEAIAAYLTDLPPSGKTQEAPTTQQLAVGEIHYTIHCGTCHLPTGLGIEGSAPPLAGSAIVNAEKPTSLINVIMHGANKPKGWTPPQHWDKSMEPFSDRLRNREIAYIATYIRGSWGNAASPVMEEDVKGMR